ncbi:MAG: bifunctional [glutamine synthetase] adenylyltransferase/[glutamine synthetase]-adenylyl-L-tyrosine phosphorylase [Candidatus Odyssella sp.]|nr:bifunctional [glutamine synthetase] adenylyltransferase/[glutamine synthetase]-adenylyl-L-tyrosine phosphorylase [Candidatus Odyssella sp.]
MGAERWREAADKAPDASLGRAARELLDGARWQPLLTGVFGSSPFLTESLIGNLDTVLDYAQSGPDAALARALAALEGDAGPEAEPAPVERALRIAKRRVSLVTALADLTADWPLETVTRTLSEFAGRAADIAARIHARRLARAGAIALAGPGLDGSGIIILGMGKLGAFELNYSSDVDLIVFYDPEKLAAPEPDRLRQHMVRFTQNAMQSLSNRTADGYVFRTDLRLRPDPASTPAAVSVLAAEVYYETMGQNWERAAMIKARPVAADRAAGDAFLARLRPFVWRRSLDFNAIQDIHSIKRQINAHRGGNAIAVLGHNVKLGRGGIREIEFFAQTQQLIFGGREPALRQRGTCDALRALAAAGRTPQAVCDELIDSYRFLRTVEHRLQMVDDQQTHTLPETDAELHAFARFCGYEGAEPFTRDLLFHLRRVEDHYGHLFEEAPSLAAPGNLVFTGVENDPDTLATIAKLGYRDPETVSTLIRGWHHGRHRAMRSARAREVLTELVPAIIAALAKSVNPDDAFRRFDTFIAQLPAGAQFFALLHANPGLLALLADIMGSAPRLAERLARRPILFDTVLSPDFHKPAPPRAALDAELAAAAAGADAYEDKLDAVRRWAQDRQFLTGVQFLRGAADAAAAGTALSDIADAVIAHLLPATEAEFARQHGRIPGAAFAVLALGKLGGRELSATSDLDLVFVYEAPEGVEQSDGAKPLAVSHYYARFAPRLLNALAAPTAEGNLYHVDLRLRPAGNKGPLASSFQAFLQYQQRDAWTWEHMALTRARFVAGDAAFGAKVMEFARGILTQPRDPERLLADVADMRRRVAEQHAARSPWEVKHVRGGLVDVEFIAQYLLLRHAHAHPGILASSIAESYGRLGAAGLVPAERAASLAAAARLLQQVQAMLRLTIEEGFDEAAATGGLKAALARAGGAADFDALKAALAAAQADVRRAYAEIIEEPAARLAAKQTREISL